MLFVLARCGPTIYAARYAGCDARQYDSCGAREAPHITAKANSVGLVSAD